MALNNNNVNVKITTTADTSGVNETEAAIGKLDKQQANNTKSTTNWSSEISKAGAIAAGLGATIGLVTKNAIDQAASYQQNRIAFETMLGSADKAKTLLMQISDFAAKTPFTLPQVQEGAKFLLAFGFAQDEIIDKFKMLGNIAAAVGTDKLPNLVNVFGQVKAAGRLMTQDLLQFTSAGVPIIDELAKHFGIAKEEVRGLVEKGKVSFDDLNASLMDLGGPAGKWGDLMTKQATTFNGTLSNVQDNLGRVLRQAVGIGPDGDIRKGSLFDVATKAATSFMNAIVRMQPTLDKIVGFFENNKAAVAALAGAIIGLVVGPLVALVVAIGWIPFAIIGVTMAFGALVGFIIANWNNIKNFTVHIWQDIYNFVSGIIGAVVGAIQWAGNEIAGVWHWIVGVWNGAWGFFANLGNQIGGVFNNIRNWIVGAFEGAYQAVTSIPGRMVALFANLGSSIRNVIGNIDIPGPLGRVRDVIPGFATGGFTGTGGVNEPAGVVHKGEYVVPQSQVDQRTGQPKALGGSSTVYNIANITISTAEAARELFNIDRNGQLASMGMSIRRAY